VVIIGLALKNIIEGTFTKEISTIATSMIALAVLLAFSEKFGSRVRSLDQTTWKDALVIGCAQACSLIPGSSRSGTTITAGLFLGLTRETAARYSFLLSIPAVIASGFYELYESRHHFADLGIASTIIATIISGIVGYATIALLLDYLKKHSTKYFIFYRLIFGGTLWVLLLLNIF
jgi:undecaprenyl-diphosphatase